MEVAAFPTLGLVSKYDAGQVRWDAPLPHPTSTAPRPTRWAGMANDYATAHDGSSVRMAPAAEPASLPSAIKPPVHRGQGGPQAGGPGVRGFAASSSWNASMILRIPAMSLVIPSLLFGRSVVRCWSGVVRSVVRP